MKAKITSVLCAALVLTAGWSARADDSGVLAISLDSTIRLSADGLTTTVDTPPVGNYAGRIGEYFGGAIIYEIAFQLPTFIPDGEAFAALGTELRLQLFGKGDTGILGNVDLYGLGIRNSSAILASDFYTGPSDPSATLIQNDLLTPSTPTRIDANTDFVITSAAANQALAAYLNTQWAGGANAGQYVFLRLSYDVSTPLPEGNNFYEVLTNEAGGATEKPLLTYATTPVPEPGTVAMIAVAGLGYLVLRRRRA